MAKKPKRPRDVSQLAKMMVDIASGETEKLPPEKEKNPAAVSRGKARMNALGQEARNALSSSAARKRWNKP